MSASISEAAVLNKNEYNGSSCQEITQYGLFVPLLGTTISVTKHVRIP